MRRGRPPLLPDKVYRVLEKMHPRVTRRHLQNLSYMYQAIEALKGTDVLGFYYDAKRDKAKVSLLAELGRLGDTELIRKVAAQAATVGRERKLGVDALRVMIRAYRLSLK